MSNSKNTNKLTEKSRIDKPQSEDVADVRDAKNSSGCTYAVTVSKKPSIYEDEPLCSGQKSFISIHSTDQPCQLADGTEPIDTLGECNVEVISLNEVFPSTSDESLSNDEDAAPQINAKGKMLKAQKNMKFTPTNSKSSTGPRREVVGETQSTGYSDFDIPKSTMYVIGSNPGEPKMSYQDPPKKISKTMKKFLRNIDKHKSEQGCKSGEKAISKLTTMRGILKDGRCGPECTGDSLQGCDDLTANDITSIPNFEFWPQSTFAKHSTDKNVTFNTKVVIIHFTGDLCVGQSVEALSKEKDQQARNSELRKSLLTKYNESWPSNK